MPAHPQWWVAWVPVVGLIVQMARTLQAFLEPRTGGGNLRKSLDREQERLFVAALVTAGTLVSVILAMIVLELRGVGR